MAILRPSLPAPFQPAAADRPAALDPSCQPSSAIQRRGRSQPSSPSGSARSRDNPSHVPQRQDAREARRRHVGSFLRSPSPQETRARSGSSAHRPGGRRRCCPCHGIASASRAAECPSVSSLVRPEGSGPSQTIRRIQTQISVEGQTFCFGVSAPAKGGISSAYRLHISPDLDVHRYSRRIHLIIVADTTDFGAMISQKYAFRNT